MHWKKREHSEAFKEYELELIRVYESALRQLNTDVFDETVQDIAQEYSQQVYTYTRDLISELKSKGYMILAISGSHHEIVEQLAKLYGIDDFVGTHYERKNDSFTGKKFVASFNKRQILEELITKHDLSMKQSYAVGDSASDIPMLAMVENPIAFNPDMQLLAEAKKRHWNIVVERKNVIYELKDNNGIYQLV
jgi:HAD superfamily hydrolase (TIGR01490 family)